MARIILPETNFDEISKDYVKPYEVSEKEKKLAEEADERILQGRRARARAEINARNFVAL